MRFAWVQTALLAWLVWEAGRSLRSLGDGGGSALGAGSTTLALVGGGLILAGIVLAGAAYRDLGASFRVVPEPGPDASLVTRGVYAHLRHPMYTAAALVAAGLLALVPSLRLGLPAVSVIVFYLIKARYEEGRLRTRYPGYEAHAGRTFGVLPWRRGR